MAKSSKPHQVADESQEEMTVVIFKLKGGSGTLQKGFDAINTAFASFGAPTLPAAPSKRLANGSGKAGGTTLPPDSEDQDEEEEDDDDTTVIDGSAKPAGKPRQPRKYKFMDDLDLSLGTKAWKEFAAEKAPKSDPDKYLVAALWLTESASIPEFGITHIFTCFRAAGWPEQRDFSQPMRQMKSKKSYFTNPSKKMWKLTGPGLDAARVVKPE
jgi:hypothetical protein